MSSVAATPAPYRPGETIRVETPGGDSRLARILSAEWRPGFNAQSRWRLTVTIDGQTFAVDRPA